MEYSRIQLKEYNDFREYFSKNSVTHYLQFIKIKQCESIQIIAQFTLKVLFSSTLSCKRQMKNPISDMFILYSEAKETATDTERSRGGGSSFLLVALIICEMRL